MTGSPEGEVAALRAALADAEARGDAFMAQLERARERIGEQSVVITDLVLQVDRLTVALYSPDTL